MKTVSLSVLDKLDEATLRRRIAWCELQRTRAECLDRLIEQVRELLAPREGSTVMLPLSEALKDLDWADRELAEWPNHQQPEPTHEG